MQKEQKTLDRIWRHRFSHWCIVKCVANLYSILFFLGSLLFVQWMEVARKNEEAGLVAYRVSIPASPSACVACHDKLSPGIIDHWEGSAHTVKGVGCVECHLADEKDADAFHHYGETLATVVTPLDCSRCHPKELFAKPGPKLMAVLKKKTAYRHSVRRRNRMGVIYLWHHEGRPILFNRILERKRKNPHVRIIDIATRRTPTTDFADM